MTAQHRHRAPTQRDVAHAASVSQATVSAVLGGRTAEQRIPTETSRRVQDAARRLGYVANPAARSLRGRRNRLLGVHTFESVFPISRRDFYHEFLLGIEEQAVLEGYDLVLFTSTQQPDGKRQIYHEGTNRLNVADGSVLLGIARGSADLAELATENYPFVHVGRRDVPDAEIPWVRADYTSAVHDVVAELVGLGHRQIAYLGSVDRLEPLDDRLTGYRAGCATARIPPLTSFVEPNDLTTRWLDLTTSQTTAFLFETVELARSFHTLLAQCDMTVPADISVVVLGVEDGPAPERDWSAIGIPRNEMGRTAVRLLVGMLTDPDGTPERQLVLACVPPAHTTIAPPPTPQQSESNHQ